MVPADNAHTQHVWDNFHCSSLKEYMALYLLNAICLLSDVFQAFRNQSLDEYQLDPANIVSAPQLAWNALRKHIDQPILLITDPEIYWIIQRNIRGCSYHASVRYAHAQNKLMSSFYDPRLQILLHHGNECQQPLRLGHVEGNAGWRF